jgi:hypothetical protein
MIYFDVHSYQEPHIHNWNAETLNTKYAKLLYMTSITVLSSYQILNVQTSLCSQNYWVLGLCPSSGILKTIKHNGFGNSICLRLQDRGG